MFIFGSGVLLGTPTADANGAPIVNGSPIEFGTLSDVSLDMSFDTKMLYGNLQFPVAVGRGKGKIGGKAKFANINGSMMNALFFGQTLNFGTISDVYDVTGTPIPSTPFAITPVVPNAGTWTRNLGVRDANGLTMTRVASAPAAGQYMVSAGVYTFAAVDTGKVVYISFQYSATSTTAVNSTIMNLPMGYAPSFAVDLYMPYQGKSLVFSCPNAIASKMSFATKQDDFMVPEFDFDIFANAAGQVMTYGVTDR